MIALDMLQRMARLCDAVIEADARSVTGDQAKARLSQIAAVAMAERPALAGVIGTLTTIKAAVAEREAPAASVCPRPANDDHDPNPSDQPGPTIA